MSSFTRDVSDAKARPMMGCSCAGMGCMTARSEFWGPVCVLDPGSVRAVPSSSSADCCDEAVNCVPSVASVVSLLAPVAAVSAALASAIRAESSAVGS